MVSEGFIDRAAAEAAYLEPLNFAAQEVSLEAPHFAVYVRQQLEELSARRWSPTAACA